jgi:hypothetical protein
MRRLTVRFGSPTDPFSRAAADPSSIGNLAIEQGLITQDELEKALEVQRQKIPKLGEIMIEIGMVTEEQRDELLFEQRRRRGQKISTEELLGFERRKMRHRLEGLKAGFREATEHAKTFADEVARLTGKPLDSSD